jgi:hypothetical protein
MGWDVMRIIRTEGKAAEVTRQVELTPSQSSSARLVATATTKPSTAITDQEDKTVLTM